MKRLMPALAAALAALPDIGCYECQVQTPYNPLILLQ